MLCIRLPGSNAPSGSTRNGKRGSGRGIESLRVVDSSVFPTIPNGNLNGPTIMVAEKAADIILGKAPLPASNAPTWIDPEWETRQRSGTPLRGATTGR